MKMISSCTSRHGCRASRRFIFPPPFSNTFGLVYAVGALLATCAKLGRKGRFSIGHLKDKRSSDLRMTSRCAMMSFNASSTGAYVAVREGNQDGDMVCFMANTYRQWLRLASPSLTVPENSLATLFCNHRLDPSSSSSQRRDHSCSCRVRYIWICPI